MHEERGEVEYIELRNAGDPVKIVFDEVAIGPERACRKVRIDGKEYLVVSKPWSLTLPLKQCPVVANYVVAPIPFKQHENGNVICYNVWESKDSCSVHEEGITFEGDRKEWGRYFLWNPETGRLTISRELDWKEVTGWSEDEMGNEREGKFMELSF